VTMIFAVKFSVLFLLLCCEVESKPVSGENELDYDPENGEFFQGDIELSPEQEKMFLSNSTDRSGRTGYFNNRWPKNNGVVIVPYVFDSASAFSKTITRRRASILNPPFQPHLRKTESEAQ
jgi:hypothetical protein